MITFLSGSYQCLSSISIEKTSGCFGVEINMDPPVQFCIPEITYIQNITHFQFRDETIAIFRAAAIENNNTATAVLPLIFVVLDYLEQVLYETTTAPLFDQVHFIIVTLYFLYRKNLESQK